MANFDFYNVTYRKADHSNQIVVKGEICNRSGRHYNAVAIRIVLFIKNIPIANTVTVINGLPNGSTKNFEKYVEEIEFDKVGRDITRHEILIESAY